MIFVFFFRNILESVKNVGLNVFVLVHTFL